MGVYNITRVNKGWHLACAAWSAAVGRGEMPEGGCAGLWLIEVITIVL